MSLPIASFRRVPVAPGGSHTSVKYAVSSQLLTGLGIASSVLTTSLQVSPVPFLVPVFAILEKIIGLVETMKNNKGKCSLLLQRCSGILYCVNDEMMSQKIVSLEPNDRLLLRVTELQEILQAIQDYIPNLLNMQLFQRVLMAQEIQGAIDGFHKRLDYAVERFQLRQAIATSLTLDSLSTNPATKSTIKDTEASDDKALAAECAEASKKRDHLLLKELALDPRTLSQHAQEVQDRLRLLHQALEGSDFEEESPQLKFLKRSFQALQRTSGAKLKTTKDWDVSELEVDKRERLDPSSAQKNGGKDFGTLWKGQWKNHGEVLLRCWRFGEEESPSQAVRFAGQGTGTESSPQLAEFQSFADSLSTISHPYIHKFLGAYVAKEKPFIVLTDRNLKGISLVDYLRKNPKGLSWHLRILQQTTEAIKYLHEDKKTTHGCIKGSNILLEEDLSKTTETALLTDVGSFRFYKSDPEYFITNARWLAPELIQTDDKPEFSRVNDTYSWAIMAYEVITNGQLPFSRESDSAIFEGKKSRHFDLPGKPSSNVVPRSKTFEELWAFLEFCWDTNGDRRPPFDTIFNKLKALKRQAIQEGLE